MNVSVNFAKNGIVLNMVARKKVVEEQMVVNRRNVVTVEPSNYFASGANKDLPFINSGCSLFDEVLGGGYVLGRMANIVGDKCLSGDSIVSVKRGTKPRKMTLKTLFKRFHGNHPNRNEDAETYVLADIGGYAGMVKMVDIRKTGIKTLYEVTDENGNSIKTSVDHRFSTPDGWKRISEGLAVGDSVHCWRGTRSVEVKKRTHKDRAVTHSIPYHPYAQKHVIAGKNYKRLPTARLVIEAAINGISLEALIDILRTNPKAASKLQYTDTGFDVHHLNGNCADDSLSNLELIPPTQHWDTHADSMPVNCKAIELTRIKSIVTIGSEPTFDIEMEWPHNFIADGFVVHNSSGKTLLAIECCANFHVKHPKGRIRYAEVESAFDKQYAEALGMPVDAVEFADGIFTIEDFFNDLQKMCKESKGQPGVYVLDSLDALSDEAEQKRGIDEGSFGGSKPKKLGELFRRSIQMLESSNILLFIVSQIRDKIGVTFGETKTRSGGKAMDFYATHIIWLAEIGKIKKTIGGVERVIGVQVKARCKKNKVGLAYRDCEYPILFGYGIDDLTACTEWLLEVAPDNLEKLGLSKNGYKVRLGNLRNKGGDEVVELRTKLTALVRKEWIRIETSFLPKSRKY